MRSFLVLTGNGPLLVMTSNSCITGEAFSESLRHKGIDEVHRLSRIPVDRLHEYYGVPFEMIAADIEGGQDLRVLDFDGPHIFNRVPLSELGAVYSQRALSVPESVGPWTHRWHVETETFDGGGRMRAYIVFSGTGPICC